MNSEARQKIERDIATKIVDEAIAQGYGISVFNGGDDPEIARSTDKEAILENMFAADMDTLIFHVAYYDADLKLLSVGEDHAFSCDLVYGNDGFDVINDYIVNEHSKGVLAPVEKYIQEIEVNA